MAQTNCRRRWGSLRFLITVLFVLSAFAPQAASNSQPTFSNISSAPTDAGLSLKQLIILLARSPDPTARAGSAEALGLLGAAASPATAALQVATYDEDPKVRAAARKALQQLVAMAQPAALPKPGPSAAPTSRVFFLFGLQRADDDGVVVPIPAPQISAEDMIAMLSGDPGAIPPEMLAILQRAMSGDRPDEVPEEGMSLDPEDIDFLTAEKMQVFSRAFPDVSFQRSLTAVAQLYYLDMKAAANYRAGAGQRGLLTVGRSLREILESDPDRVAQQLNHKMFRPYKRDYVVRAEANNQIKYEHRRYLEGEEFSYGANTHLNMMAGDYQVDYIIYTSEGHRLPFRLPLTIRSMTEMMGGSGADVEIPVGKPSDVAKSYREQMAKVDMSKPDALRQKSDHALSIAYGLSEAASNILSMAGATAAQVEPFLAEAVSMHELAARHGDKSWSFDHGKVVMTAAEANTQQSFDLALKETRLAEQWAQTMDPKGKDSKTRDRWGDMGVAYNFLAAFHIGHRNDVLRARSWLERVLSLKQLRGQAVDPARERASWPQPWWRDEWNRERPGALQGDIEDVRIAGRETLIPAAGPGAVSDSDVQDQAEREAFGKLGDMLRDAYEELRDKYAEDARWMSGISDLVKTAYVSTDQAWKELTLKREAIAELQGRIKYLKGLKARLAKSPSNDYLEDFFQWSIARVREFQRTWNYDGTPPPKKVGEMRAALDRIINRAQTDVRGLRQEQDGLIKERIDRFQNILDELDARGSKTDFKRHGAEIADQKKMVKDRMELARAQLLLAAGKDEFRDHARSLIKQGKSVGMVRYLEGMHFLQKKDVRRALHSFRTALLERISLEQPHKEGKPANPKLTKLGELEQMKKAAVLVRKDPDMGHWTGQLFEDARDKELLRLDPARYWIRKLELEYLRGIDNKAMGEAALVRDATWKSLSKHGEKGYWGAIKDLVTSGATGSGAAIMGLHETVARDQGTVLNDAARQHIGLGIITRLREKGYGLSQIRGLNTQAFVDTVKKEFNWQLKPDAALKMVGTLKYAFGNPDLKILQSWDRQSMDIESGKKYYDPDDFSTAVNVGIPLTDMEIDISDIANVKNVAMFFGPNALIQRPGFMKGMGQLAGQTSSTQKLKDMVTLKEAFADRVGLHKVVNAIGSTSRGREAIRSLLLTDSSMTWVGKAAADASMMLAMRESAEFVGRAGSALVTGLRGNDPDPASQQWWAEAFGEAATTLGAFGLADYDVTVGLARSWQRESLHRAAANIARVRLNEALEMDRATLGMMRRHSKVIEDGMARMGHRIVPPPLIKGVGPPKQRLLLPPGKVPPKALPRQPLLLPPGDAEPLFKARTEIQEQVEKLLFQIRSPNAAPAVVRRLSALKTAYNAMESLDDGFAGEAGTWNKLLKDAREALDARLKYDTLVPGAVAKVPTAGQPLPASMRGAGAGRMPQSITRNSLQPHEIEYGSAGAFRTGDSLMRRRAFEAAQGEYREMAELFNVVGDPGNKFAREAMTKLNEADGAIRAAAKVRAAAKGIPRGPLRALDPITDQDLAIYQGLNLTSKNLNKPRRSIWQVERAAGGITEPKKIYLKVGRVGGGETFKARQPLMYFKPSRAGTLDAETEEVFSWVAQAAGVTSPTARVGKLTVDDIQMHGVYVRNIPGEELAGITVREPGMRHVFTADVAEDLPVRVFAKDWDPHGKNFKVRSDGGFGAFDRNGGSLLDDPRLAGDPDAMRESMVAKLKDQFWSKRGVGIRRHYWEIAEMHKRMTWQQVETKIARIEALSPTQIQAKVNAVTSLTDDQRKLALQGLLTRQKVLRGAVKDYMDWVKVQKLPKAPLAPDPGSVPWLREAVIKTPPAVRAAPR